MQVIKKYEITRIENSRAVLVQDPVIVEHTLALYLNGAHFVDFRCSPNELEALVLGHLYSRGIIQSKNDLQWYSIEKNRAEVALRKTLFPPEEEHGAVLSPLPVRMHLKLEALFQAAHLLDAKSPLFAATGGAHGCGLYLCEGRHIISEDLGRHNAIDKALGRALLSAWDLSRAFLVTGARVSGEMIRKALNTGLSLLVSRSAPTHRAVELARAGRVTLCGFTRGRRVNIYSAPERILLEQGDPQN